MIIRVILLAAAIFLLLHFLGYLKKLPPQHRRQALIKYGGYGILLVVILLAATGRLHWIGAVIAAIIPFAKQIGHFAVRALPFLRWLQQQKLKPSILATPFLKVVIDSKTGQWQGQIIQGNHSGKNLNELTQEQLIELSHQYLQQDPASARLLNAYMRYRFQQGSDQGSSQNQTADNGNMNRKEALEVLGLDEEASEKDIVAAHRSLMQKVHPDRGGSDYLAAKINQAKDTLLKA
ncbi:MAG: hypothetical protein AseanaTS_12950 [Candidatus Pelagadaptatus aseana]|uniref:molecular chaperone DnaJ n=1 Tax=Candidatus Pelagadaptatus aseana TaxID=3120508 RepID=UPI0039B2777E